MIRNIYTTVLFLLTGLLFSCKGSQSDTPGGDGTGAVKTPVTVTAIRHEPMTDYVTMNATTAFMMNNIIRSSVNGYVQDVAVMPGQAVKAGQPLFTLKTKEAHAIEGAPADTLLQFNGIVRLKAPKSGYVSQLSHQEGDYVQDGEQLCVISDRSSFAILLSAPFELNAILRVGKHCMILLPDSTQLPGTITSRIATVDSVSQTQRYQIRVNTQRLIPENLVVRVRIIRSQKPDAAVLPRSAVLTNETQSEWSVMKLINDSTAVKVPVEKGMETGDKVEILSPKFTAADRIITAGGYGLPDTALVKVQQ